MDISISSGVNGFFSYKIFHETPDNVIFESSEKKNLIVNSGLEHLYSLPVTEVIKTLDLGSSGAAPDPSDVGLRGPLTNTNIFKDLLPLEISANAYAIRGSDPPTRKIIELDSKLEIIEQNVPSYELIDLSNPQAIANIDQYAIEYTVFFRTKTTATPISLREFVIKPGPNTKAFARQVFDTVRLKSGDGIEFTYKVRIHHKCGLTSSALQMYYYNGLLDDNVIRPPDIWSPLTYERDYKIWSGIAAGNKVLVAVASGDRVENFIDSNIAYSKDGGSTWLVANDKHALYSLDIIFNSVVYADLRDKTDSYNPIFVAVGPEEVYYSNTGSEWLPTTPAEYRNWTSIAFGDFEIAPSAFDISSVNPVFIAVSDSGARRAMKSIDGIKWAIINNSILNASTWKSITYGENTFVAVANAGGNRIAYSKDAGATWIAARPPAQNKWCSIAYGNGLFVAVSKDATYSPIMYAFASNVSKWYPAKAPNSQGYNTITFGEGYFVAMGDRGEAAYSRDGIGWFVSRAQTNSKSWSGVIYDKGNNAFFATASGFDQSSSFAKSQIKPSSKPFNVNVDAILLPLGINEKIVDADSVLYTLRDFNMPKSNSLSNIIYSKNDLQFSSTYSFNSYAKSTTTFLPPNSAIFSYVFDDDTGHGAIKYLLFTDSLLPSKGNLIVELNAPSFLGGESVITGIKNSLITLPVPREGSIVRNLSADIPISESTFEIKVSQTWGTALEVYPNSNVVQILSTSNISINNKNTLEKAYKEALVNKTKSASITRRGSTRQYDRKINATKNLQVIIPRPVAKEEDDDSRPSVDIVIPGYIPLNIAEYNQAYKGYVAGGLALFQVFLQSPERVYFCPSPGSISPPLGNIDNDLHLILRSEPLANANQTIIRPDNKAAEIKINPYTRYGSVTGFTSNGTVSSAPRVATADEIRSLIQTTPLSSIANAVNIINRSSVTAKEIRDSLRFSLNRNSFAGGQISEVRILRRVDNALNNQPGTSLRIYFDKEYTSESKTINAIDVISFVAGSKTEAEGGCYDSQNNFIQSPYAIPKIKRYQV